MRARRAWWAVPSAAIAVSLLGDPTPAAAQMQTQFTPFLAGYYATRELGDLVDPTLQGGSALQNNAVAIGAGVSVMMTDILGVEASAAYTFSKPRVQFCDGSGVCAFQDVEGTLTMTSLAARLRPRRSNFVALGGLSAVFRGGEIWQNLDNKMSIGGMLGAGVLARVAPKFGLDVRGELYFYSFDPDGDNTSWEPALAVDVLVKIGVPLPGR